jgi:internalin A
MVDKINCSLFILGDKGVGKTTLIKSITENKSSYFEETTRSVTISDWRIRYEDQEINVVIKESSSISEKILISMLRKENDSSIINIVLPNSKNINFKKTCASWLNKIKRFVNPKTIVIVTLNFNNPDDLEKFKLPIYKKEYSFVRYWVNRPQFNDNDGNFASDEYQYLVRQIILNKFSNRLVSVRRLIEINRIKKSKILDIGRFGLTSLLEVSELFQNSHIENLILSNEWGEFVNGRWVRRESINNSHPNILYDIPEEIRQLGNLKVLICGGNWKSKRNRDVNISKWHIDDISNLFFLPNLTILNVSNNEINNVGQINRISKLTKLYLNNNNINKFPTASKLTVLKELYLSNNKLTSVGFLEGLNTLKTIDLHSNRIKDLSPIKYLISKLDIKDTKWEVNTISILNNPIVIPSLSTISKGKKGVLAFFKQLEAEHKVKLKPFINRDLKLILVGNSNVGKSTLIHWLINEEVDKTIKTTHWMNVKPWSAKNGNTFFNVRVFDFGGQEYYHDTHHLFFTNRTAYLTLWDEKSNKFDEVEIEQIQIDNTTTFVKIQTFPLEYWLESIHFHTKRRDKTRSEKEIENLLNIRDKSIGDAIKKGSQRAKRVNGSVDELLTKSKNEENILIVQNKVDHQKDKKYLNEKLLKKQHGKIYDFSSISVLEENGLASFRNKLFEVFSSLDIVNQEGLGTWGHIKQSIEKEIFLEPYTLTKLKDYCNQKIKSIPEIKKQQASQIQKVLFDDQDVELFAEYLADIGVALYYPDNQELKSKVFLNQNRIIESIYKVLYGLASQDGEFNKDKILNALNKTETDQEVFDLIDLMIHFKIIFQHPSKSETFIAPLYLPKEPPQGIKLFSTLFSKPVYRYRYRNFIHKNIILDFFKRYGKKVLNDSVKGDSYQYWREGIVVKDEITGEIIMVKFIPGNEVEQSALIDVYVINKKQSDDFLKMIIHDLDKSNEDWFAEKLVTANGNDFVPIELIQRNEEQDNWVFFYNERIYKLADFKKYLNKKPKMKKVFISYSKSDSQHLAKLENHLSILRRNGTIDTWNCRKLLPGEKWDGKIKKELEEADVIIFLVSDDFLATDYIWDVEIKRAIERDNDPNDFVKVVPVIVRACVWEDSPLGVYNTAPKKAEVIKSADDIDEAWTNVVKDLKKIL